MQQGFHQNMEDQLHFLAPPPLRFVPFQISASLKKQISGPALTQSFRLILAWFTPSVHHRCFSTESEKNLARNSGLIHVGLDFFPLHFPSLCIQSLWNNKVCILNSLFLWLWLKELSWIIPQPSSTFGQDHSACTLNSINLCMEWFSNRKIKHGRDTVLGIQKRTWVCSCLVNSTWRVNWRLSSLLMD